MSFIRGFNPVWFEVDLAGLAFDDTYYMFVLQNTFPYLPATVYHDLSGTTPWNNPIRFFANGTLPIDIFFDDSQVYRLEFRHGSTQSDPLIYLVENYSPGSGATPPITSVALISDNQITNNQFSLINFSSPLVLTSVTTQTIDVAPGWFLDLTGTGSITLTQVPLNDSAGTLNPTNAPFALQITVSGWDDGGVVLRQRFDVNGMLWANKTVASSITARIEGAPQSISATLVDSNGTTLAEVLASIAVNSEFNEYQGFGTLGDTTNPDVPPSAYIEYLLALPSAVDIYVTSFQLVSQNIETVIPYIQDSIERQRDYTFHYYRESLLTQPKESLLTGWDFGLNPWQFTTTSSTTLTSKCAYTADQTIVYQQGGASQVAVGRAIADENYAFEVKAVTATNRFALIQYIDPTTVRDVWGYLLSSLARGLIVTSNDSTIRFKMRLIYRASLPSPIGAAEPIASWTGANEPVLAAGWTYITPRNDPTYTFGTTSQAFTFEGLQMPASTNDNMTLGIMIYTLDNMDETGTADRILFERVSLCRNDFAIDGQILTFDETLRRCQFYWESSKNLFTIPSASGAEGALIAHCRAVQSAGNILLFPLSFDIAFSTVKRGTPEVDLYNLGGTITQTTVFIRDNGVQIATSSVGFSLGWISANNANKGIQFVSVAQTLVPLFSTTGTVTNSTDGYASFHYSADSRLGV